MALGIEPGVWPTMITPYRSDGEIDYEALQSFVDWFVERGVTGIFAVCKSSEMFELSLRERLELSRATVAAARGRLGVVSSGHVAWSLADQIDEAKAMADTGPQAVVLVTNRFAAEDEDDDAFRRNLERFLAAMPPGLRFGFYECPYPYKRVLSAAATRFVVSTGRFDFLKDTCCDIDLIRAKLEATSGSSFRIFNANAATLLQSLRAGAAGYSGVMGNFHPELYVELCRTWSRNPARAEELQAALGIMSVIEARSYPLNAKYMLAKRGIFSTLQCRGLDRSALSPALIAETEEMSELAESLARRLGIGAGK